jgi:hypothetical protein
MLTYKYIDDGYYCRGWWVYDGERRFCDAHSEADAKEICDAVNIIRKLSERVYTIAQSVTHGA